MELIICSDCFLDQGLRLDAERLGTTEGNACPQCGSELGRKLNEQQLADLTYRFFVWGSFYRTDYGGAPAIQFNEYQETSINLTPQLQNDANLISRILGIGFFHYGPRLWFLGEIEPLKALIDPKTRPDIISNILINYPTREIGTERKFYRIRKSPEYPENNSEYDSPPDCFLGSGRLDSNDLPVLYTSPDLEVCLHECRVTAEDELYVATLSPSHPLKVLDLSVMPEEREDISEFESLDIAIHMLFMAGKHSYEITRDIALAAHQADFDGIIYPSYFSLLRLGVMPLRNIRGISHRKIPELRQEEEAFAVPNLGVFGHPIQSGKLNVSCLNKITLTRVEYNYIFGPASF